MNDSEIQEHAKRLGIDISNMSWNERLSTISKALAEENNNTNVSDELENLKQELAVERARNKELKVKYENYDSGRAPTHDEMVNIPIEIAPYIPEKGAPGKPKGITKEELNYDVAYEVNDFTQTGMPQGMQQGENQFGTFQHKGYKQEKVIGTRGDPCFNAGLVWRPGDMFWSVYIGNIDKPEREEFLWAQVKQTIKSIRNGIYLSKYRTELYGNQQAGVQGQINQIKGRYTISKPYANELIDKIQKEERVRAQEEKKESEGISDV